MAWEDCPRRPRLRKSRSFALSSENVVRSLARAGRRRRNGQPIANGEPLVIRYPALYDPGGSLQPLQNLLVIPCFFHLSVLGVLVLANRAEGFDEEIVEHLTTLSDSIGTLLHVRELELARQAAEAELARQATLDPLTGLLNRRGFAEALAASRAAEPRGVLAYLDMDGLKRINDLFGHDAEILKASVDFVLRRRS